MNNPAETTAHRISGWIPALWQNKRVRVLLQILFLLGMGALTTLAKGISCRWAFQGTAVCYGWGCWLPGALLCAGMGLPLSWGLA